MLTERVKLVGTTSGAELSVKGRRIGASLLARTRQVQIDWHSGLGSANHLGRLVLVFKLLLRLFEVTTLSGSVSVRMGGIVGCEAETCLRK
jgi:hypothetical protein